MSVVKLDLGTVMEVSGELARYRVPSGERVVLVHPEPGGAEILDVPASGAGGCFRVGKARMSGAALQGLVSEYVGHARELGCCPMDAAALVRIVDWSEEGLADVLVEAIGDV